MCKLMNKRVMASAVICGATMLCMHSVYAGEPEKKVADEYMKVFSALDLQKMKAFYREDARFYDPTTEAFGKDYTWDMSGRSAILKKFDAYFSKYDRAAITYNLKERYESGGHNVFTGKVKISFVTNGKLETACVAATSIVSVKDGKVIEHRDYYDYNNFAMIKGDQDC